MKSSASLRPSRPLLPAVSRKPSSGLRRAVQPTPSSFLEDFGEETTAVELASSQLVAATAARDDRLDLTHAVHDDTPTSAMPVDVAVMLSLIAAQGLASPVDESSPPASSSCLMPQLIHADYVRSPPPAIRLKEVTPAALPRPTLLATPSMNARLALVALGSFTLTIAAVAMLVWLFGVPMLRP